MVWGSPPPRRRRHASHDKPPSLYPAGFEQLPPLCQPCRQTCNHPGPLLGPKGDGPSTPIIPVGASRLQGPVDSVSFAAAEPLEASGLEAAGAKSQKMTLLLTPGKGQISLP